MSSLKNVALGNIRHFGVHRVCQISRALHRLEGCLDQSLILIWHFSMIHP